MLFMAVSAAGQDKVDGGIEEYVINAIADLTASLSAANTACDTESPRCDKERIAKISKELRAARNRAFERDTPLLQRLVSETDPAIVGAISKRHVALLAAIADADKALGAEPATEAERLEKELIGRIAALRMSVVDLTAICEKADPSCDLDRLARERFALRDAMSRATKIDNKILADLPKASLADTPKLHDRHLRLLEALEPARKISFTVHEDRAEADELVDRVKALDEKLTQTENAHGEMKDALKKATGAEIEKARKEKEKVAKEEARLRTVLAELETKARAQGIADRQRIGKIDEDLKSGKTSLKFADLIAERELVAKRLGEIESVVTIPSDGNPLYRVYDDDYEDWWIHQFYLGGEFDSVSGILSKGFARMGYTSWVHTGGENIPESHPRRGFGNYGRHYIFNGLLTSSAEQNISKLLSPLPATDPCATNTTSTDPCVRRALATEFKIWVPIHRTRRHNRVRFYTGPVFSLGASFVDPNEADRKTLQAAYRYYGGVRTSFARDAYSELLLGKSNTLNSRRLEVRGEVPVAKWGAKSRLLIGWNANIRASGHATYEGLDANGDVVSLPERDVYRVYLSYEVDFLTLTGLTAPK